MSRVSIILPTYNRANFLRDGIEAILRQSFTDWELIIVDDGSTDETADLVSTLCSDINYHFRYIRQENLGPAEARNAGINISTGEYVAFFDSDDLWLPHHLAECVDVLQAYPDIGWVYSAMRIVDFNSGAIVEDNRFEPAGELLSFLTPERRRCGELYVVNAQDALAIAIGDELHCPFQASLIRSSVFKNRMIPPFRVGEDQTFSILAALDGVTFGCLNSIHVVYRQHPGGISSGPGRSHEQIIRARREFATAFASLLEDRRLEGPLLRKLRRRVSNEWFWGVGNQLDQCGIYPDAQHAYWKALRMFPWTPCRYKTIIGSYIRMALHMTKSLRRTAPL